MTALYEDSPAQLRYRRTCYFFAAPESHDNKVKKALADESPAPEVLFYLKISRRNRQKTNLRTK